MGLIVNNKREEECYIVDEEDCGSLGGNAGSKSRMGESSKSRSRNIGLESTRSLVMVNKRIGPLSEIQQGQADSDRSLSTISTIRGQSR